jgi:hypothetical protein
MSCMTQLSIQGRYRDKLIEAMNAFISVVNAEQIRTNLFTPVREALDDINERLSELKRRAGELLDPREVRERLLSLARAQFEALTAPFRALAEAQQAWSDFMSDLTGDLTREAVDAANNLSAAFMNVLKSSDALPLDPKKRWRSLQMHLNLSAKMQRTFASTFNDCSNY